MPMTFEVSESLQQYLDAVSTWASSTAVRSYARELDGGPAVPALTPVEALELAARALAAAPLPTPADPIEDANEIRRGLLSELLGYTGDALCEEELLPRDFVLGYIIDALGTPEQAKHWRAVLSRPEVRTGFALTEHGFGSDTTMVSTTAVRDGDTWVLNGSKMYCSHGAIAQYLAVFATIDKSLGANGIKVFIVPATAPGFTVVKYNEDKLGIRSHVTSELAFDDCVVPVDHMLGWSEHPPTTTTRSSRGAGLGALAANRPNLSANANGLARAALDLAREHVEERRTSYAPRRWAKIQNELDLMEASLERSRLLVLKANWTTSEHIPNQLESSTAKAYGPPTAERVVCRCMQIVGHEGTSHAHLFEKLFRDVRIKDIAEGTGQIHRRIIARQLFGRDPERD
jgi:acyl-CoA dehydrogenase